MEAIHRNDDAIHRSCNQGDTPFCPRRFGAGNFSRLTAGALGALMSVAAHASNCADAPVSGKVYTLVNEGSGLYLDVDSYSKDDGASIKQWSANGMPNQQWTLTSLNGGWSIRPVHDQKALDVYGWQTADGTPIKQWSYTGNANQQFSLKATGSGAFNIVSSHSSKLVSVKDNSIGSPAYQDSDRSSANQRWFLNPVDGKCTKPSANKPAPAPTQKTESCELPSRFSWVSTQPLIAPQSADFVSIKDPTIVRYNDLYHVFATVFDTSRNKWSAVYMNFSDFSKASSAVQVPLANKPVGDAVAPQVFYFRPHKKWYLISQWGARYSTNSDISNPDGWTAPKPLLSNGPHNGIDYWVICDSKNCHLFFSGDDGNLYHSKTTLENFPNFSGFDTVLADSQARLFEASNVYKIQGTDKYLMLVEAYAPRYFRSWTSTSLDGPWTPLADTQSEPFAGAANVSFDGARWTNDISHGEMIRAGYDETLAIDPCNMQYLYQGVDPSIKTKDYDKLPYRLGVLRAK